VVKAFDFDEPDKIPAVLSVLKSNDIRLTDWLNLVEGILVYGRQPGNRVKPTDENLAIAMARAFRDIHLAQGGGSIVETRISSEQYKNIYRGICAAPAVNEKAVCPRP